ncbi:MAG TPA: hypothetical protein PLD25_26545 [Chloroflexota bacterium]|nr:hypothetical protein [Chloroflexota bacterium]
MTTQQLSLRQQIELELIKGDAFLYFELMLKLSESPSAGILYPSLAPYFSLFIIESYKYLHRSFPAYNESLSDTIRPIITSSRMRVKFFDDTQNEIEGTLDIFKWIKDFHNEWHIGQHKGLLAPIKRVLQDDLGVTFYTGHIIGSTHTGILNLGYSKDDLPTRSEDISPYISQLSFNVGNELGLYMTRVLSFPEMAPSDADFGRFIYKIKDDQLKYKDEKSDRLLQHVFNGPSSETINLSLLLFLTHVNFLLYILSNLVVEQHYTIFKLKYIVLYHLRSSLEKLYNHDQSNRILTDRSRHHLEAIISDLQFRELTEQRLFRNILVHYGIGRDLERDLSLNTRFFGLTELFFNGHSYEVVFALVETQIIRVSTILEDWLNWKIRAEGLHN